MSRNTKLNKAFDSIIRVANSRRRELAMKGAMLDDGYLNALYYLKNQIEASLQLKGCPNLRAELIINRHRVTRNIWDRIAEIKDAFKPTERQQRTVGNYKR